MIKVLLVDDHELITSAIKFMLNAADNITVIGVASSGENAILAVAKNQPDVIFMDVEMSGMSGTEACKHILQAYPNIKIIGLSQYDSNAVTQKFIKLGAVGFISKSATPEEMIHSVHKAMAGDTYLSLDVQAKRALKKEGDDNNPCAILSSKELDVVELILQGKSIKEMVDIMDVKDKTINSFRYRIYKKLSIKNDVELLHLINQYKRL